ncbi:MAG: hypothetical protein ACKVP2_12775 [Burkholderiales bacterium]
MTSIGPIVRFIVFATLLTLCAAASAMRNFPENARRGEITGQQYPALKIGDKVYRLAPGAKIYDRQNMIMIPTALPKKKLPVLYTIDFNGHLSNVWLLTDEELRRYEPVK